MKISLLSQLGIFSPSSKKYAYSRADIEKFVEVRALLLSHLVSSPIHILGSKLRMISGLSQNGEVRYVFLPSAEPGRLNIAVAR